MMLFHAHAPTDRRQLRLQELRHQLRYATSSDEREQLRVQLDFWRRLPASDIPE